MQVSIWYSRGNGLAVPPSETGNLGKQLRGPIPGIASLAPLDPPPGRVREQAHRRALQRHGLRAGTRLRQPLLQLLGGKATHLPRRGLAGGRVLMELPVGL